MLDTVIVTKEQLRYPLYPRAEAELPWLAAVLEDDRQSALLDVDVELSGCGAGAHLAQHAPVVRLTEAEGLTVRVQCLG